MFQRGLKTNIAITLAVILFLGMALTDFIMVIMTQQDMIRHEIDNGNQIISAIEARISNFDENENNEKQLNKLDDIRIMLDEAGFSCALILDVDNNPIYVDDKKCIVEDDLVLLAKQSIESGKQKSQFLGTTWGVFWKQRRHLILSSPLFKNGRIVAGAALVFPLERIYEIHRHSQYLLFLYMLVNTAILTLIGLYRLSMSMVKPLNRLVKRASEYSDDDEFFIMSEKEGNEFNKLSKALNSMLSSISEDKKKLRQTVRSLEKANFDLKQAQKDIIRAEKLASVGRLSSGIAHEIGNPVGIVLGYIELLKKKDISDEERKEFIDRAESEINRINLIIRQLLDLSRPSTEGPEPVSAHYLINDVIDVLRPQPVMSDVLLQLDLAAHRDTVFVDPNQLRQVFLNLVMNALDAISTKENEADKKIIISSEVVEKKSVDSGDPSMIQIVFFDNGHGISDENIGTIFDPFYTTKDPGEGTGLGLSVCFMIVEGMNGEIKATSKEGEGTKMTVCLPLVPLETGETVAD